MTPISRARRLSTASSSRASSLRQRLVAFLVRDSGQGRARGILRIWPLWERLSRRLWPTVEIPESPHGLVAIHFGPYKGKAILLPDGTEICSGDKVAEIHFNNRIQIEALGQARGAEKWRIVTILRQELTALAAWTKQTDFPHDVKAIYAVSILSRGAVRLGFTIRSRPPGFRSRMDSLFLSGLLILYGSEGLDRANLGQSMGGRPTEVWMSRDELMRRYGEG